MSKKLISKVLLLLLVPFVIFATWNKVSVNAEAVNTFTITVNVDSNVRIGPGRAYRAIGIAAKGTELVAVEKTKNGWYKVVYNNVFGYINNKTVTVGDSITNKGTNTKKAPAYDVNTLALQAFNAINDHRLSKGLPPLMWNPYLFEAACKRANELVQRFSHTRPDGRGFETAIYDKGMDFNTAGETIANGMMDGQEVVNAWINSTKHREVLESKYMTNVGIGVFIAPDGSVYYVGSFLG